ncbi:hypothetical protein quinque_011229 [Culex quinquefasciatus]
MKKRSLKNERLQKPTVQTRSAAKRKTVAESDSKIPAPTAPEPLEGVPFVGEAGAGENAPRVSKKIKMSTNAPLEDQSMSLAAASKDKKPISSGQRATNDPACTYADDQNDAQAKPHPEPIPSGSASQQVAKEPTSSGQRATNDPASTYADDQNDGQAKPHPEPIPSGSASQQVAKVTPDLSFPEPLEDVPFVGEAGAGENAPRMSKKVEMSTNASLEDQSMSLAAASKDKKPISSGQRARNDPACTYTDDHNDAQAKPHPEPIPSGSASQQVAKVTSDLSFPEPLEDVPFVGEAGAGENGPRMSKKVEMSTNASLEDQSMSLAAASKDKEPTSSGQRATNDPASTYADNQNDAQAKPHPEPIPSGSASQQVAMEPTSSGQRATNDPASTYADNQNDAQAKPHPEPIPSVSITSASQQVAKVTSDLSFPEPLEDVPSVDEAGAGIDGL